MDNDQTFEQLAQRASRSWTETLAGTGVFVAVCGSVLIWLQMSDEITPPMLQSLAVLGLLTVMTFYDLRRFILPDVLTFSLILVGLVWAIWSGDNILLSISGAIIGFGLFWLIDTFWRFQFGKSGLGRGDAKLLAGGGALCGALQLPAILFVSSGTALLIVFAQKMAGNRNRDQLFPFGPFLATGIWITWIGALDPLFSF